jgi:HAD superfamily hydrolase (TIGR01662 family)
MIKAIIFDIGGTLVRTDVAIMQAIDLALKQNNIKLKKPEAVIHDFGKSTYFNVKTAVEVSYSGSDTEDKIKKCFYAFKQIFPNDVLSSFILFPNTINILKSLKDKGVKLAIFTAFDRKEADFFLKKMKLSKFFHNIITVDDVDELRPHPDALILAAKKLKVKTSECIYVGDTIADIQMAKNAGMEVVCVKTGIQDNKKLVKEHPDYLVRDLNEMMKKLSKKFKSP